MSDREPRVRSDATKRRSIVAAVVALIAIVGGIIKVWLVDRALSPSSLLPSMKIAKKYTVDERVAQFGTSVAERLAPSFAQARLAYPPGEIAYVAFKDARRLEVYARATRGAPWRFLRDYDVRGASGVLGPKLAEGDNQVPEGVYRAEFLNANSRFHLSIRLNYPNEFDRAQGVRDGRTNLGSDIMIHGSSWSVGCLAMGDEAAEELFVLAALVGKDNVRIVVSPTDFRQPEAVAPQVSVGWATDLYAALRAALQEFPRPTRPGA